MQKSLNRGRLGDRAEEGVGPEESVELIARGRLAGIQADASFSAECTSASFCAATHAGTAQ
jgi:hypothetical protein